jgi:hypothetical protein
VESPTRISFGLGSIISYPPFLFKPLPWIIDAVLPETSLQKQLLFLLLSSSEKDIIITGTNRREAQNGGENMVGGKTRDIPARARNYYTDVEGVRI